MITGSSSIVGEPFKKYVSDQIDVRQSIFASGLNGTNRTPQQLQYINGSNSWVKMASSVSVDDDKGKAKLREIFNDTETADLLGTNLAKNFVLFNGLSFFQNPFQSIVPPTNVEGCDILLKSRSHRYHYKNVPALLSPFPTHLYGKLIIQRAPWFPLSLRQ